jgi:small subunit ribosomal protein S16
MVRIRLRRVGKKGKAFYRVVVADQHSPRDGAFIEQLGSYDPHANPPSATLNEERTRHWLSVGAQPSEPVARILQRQGYMSAAAAPAEPAAAAASSEA